LGFKLLIAKTSPNEKNKNFFKTKKQKTNPKLKKPKPQQNKGNNNFF